MAQLSPSKSTMGLCQQQEMRWTQIWLRPLSGVPRRELLHFALETSTFLSKLLMYLQKYLLCFGPILLELRHHMTFISVHAGCDILGWLALDEIVLAVSFAFHKHDSSLVPALGHEILEPFYLLVHPYRCLPTRAAFWQCHSLIIAIMRRTVWCNFPMVPDEYFKL